MYHQYMTMDTPSVTNDTIDRVPLSLLLLQCGQSQYRPLQQSLKDLQWLTRDSNWKYLFPVPSRAKAYQEKDQEMWSRSNSIIGEYSFIGIKFQFTDQDFDSDGWISEETDAGEDTSSLVYCSLRQTLSTSVVCSWDDRCGCSAL